MSKTNHEMLSQFMGPLFKIYLDYLKNGENNITYNAPLALYFYGSPYNDAADPIIAATYAMVAGESLGLGSCMIGGIHPFMQYGSKAAELRLKYGIQFKSKEGLVVLFGYPKFKFVKGIQRSFAGVEFRN